jgi:hypothetical protein
VKKISKVMLNSKMTNYVMDMTVWAVFTSWMLQHAAQGNEIFVSIRVWLISEGSDTGMSKEL